MQKSNVDFYPVLLLSILADTLLRLHTGYWARCLPVCSRRRC